MIEQFKFFAQNICSLFLEEGILIRPFSNPRLPFFSSLSLDEQKTVLSDLKSYLDLCETMKQQGRSLKSTRELTDQALLQLGLRAEAHHLEVIENHHLVEIYNLNHIQIFRSFRFFEVSSYTLEDIHCRKWWHLYERSPADEATIQKIVADFLNSPKKTLCRVDMPEHLIREKDTLERLVVKTQLLWLIPLYRGNEFDSHERCELVSPERESCDHRDDHHDHQGQADSPDRFHWPSALAVLLARSSLRCSLEGGR